MTFNAKMIHAALLGQLDAKYQCMATWRKVALLLGNTDLKRKWEKQDYFKSVETSKKSYDVWHYDVKLNVRPKALENVKNSSWFAKRFEDSPSSVDEKSTKVLYLAGEVWN